MSWTNKSSFYTQNRIVIEEADESEFWLEFVIDEKLKTKKVVEDLRKEAYEMTSIFIKSRKTAQQNL